MAETTVRAIGRSSRPYGNRAPVKRQDYAVLHYVLRGSGWFDGVKIGPGQGFYVPADEFHSYQASAEDPWEYLFIDMELRFAERVAVPVIHADGRGIFSFSFGDWLKKWAAKNMGKAPMTFISETEAVYYAALILRQHGTEQSENGSKQLNYVQNAQVFIEESLNHRLLVSDVAKAVNLNQRYLCALFVAYTGIGIKEYIIDRKMQAAKELLTETTLTVKEISLEIGIADSNSFSKSFKLKTGLSPREFRDQNTK